MITGRRPTGVDRWPADVRESRILLITRWRAADPASTRPVAAHGVVSMRHRWQSAPV
jgi:hypothetical protein